jgi:HK97 family phage portal protein
MKILGFQVPFTSRQAALPRQRRAPATLEMAGERGTWRTLFDFRTGAWQQHDSYTEEGEVAEGTNTAIVYACLRRIAGDIGKMGACVKRLTGAIWEEGTHQVWSKLIRRPNRFQTWGLFIKCWVYSLLLEGNAYVVKLYGASGLIEELIVLDPTKVTPHVSEETGEVWYHVGGDPLARISDDSLFISALDLIHHPYMPLGHPLIGTSPLARALSASRAREGIVANSANLTANGAVPPLVVTVPEGTPEVQVKEIANKWRRMPKHRAAVIDASIKVDQLAAKYVDSQAAEIAELSGVDICAAFDVPPWKVGLEPAPAGDIEARQIAYYQDSLQWIVEDIEELLDHGLGLPTDTAIEFDEGNLLRLDSKTRAEVDAILIKGVKTPNEARKGWNLPKVAGGDSVYMQQQNYSLEALHKRDQAAPAPSTSGASPQAPGGANSPGPADDDETDAPSSPEDRRTPSLPWAGVWKASEEYPLDCGFVTHNGSLWARVWRADKAAEIFGTPLDTEHGEPGEEIGAEPGTPEGAPYWQLAVMRGKAPTKEGV